MIALELTDVKDFMNKLLRSEIFDHFLMQEAVITSAATYTINGQITKGFYSPEELEELHLNGCRFLPFYMLRGNCFDLIKGKKTPSQLKIVLKVNEENTLQLLNTTKSALNPNDIDGMFLNIIFQEKDLNVICGISYQIFTMEKALESEFTNQIIQLFKANNITCE